MAQRPALLKNSVGDDAHKSHCLTERLDYTYISLIGLLMGSLFCRLELLPPQLLDNMLTAKSFGLHPVQSRQQFLLVNPFFTRLLLLLSSTLMVHSKYLSSIWNQMHRHCPYKPVPETLSPSFPDTHKSGWRSGRFLFTSNVSGSASRFFQT